MMKISLSPEEFRKIIISHHPDCECFKDDVINIGNYKICAGCATAYPVAFILFILLWPINQYSIYFSVLLAMFSLTRKFIKSKALKIILRSIAGIALGFGLGGFIWAVEEENILLIILIMLSGLTYGYIRLYFIKRKIEKCKCNKKSIS